MKARARALERVWYQTKKPFFALVPFEVLYHLIVALRRRAYRRGWLRSTRVGVPVLVVGNITVGGSGKTPLTVALVDRLQARDLRVGVVSRGYGGRAAQYPLDVTLDTSPASAGDEPVLIAQRNGVPVVVDPDRVRAARRLIDWHGVDCIVADDGLQHYRLARDIEISVSDARRGLGNGRLLPAGPLREPAARLECVDLALIHGPGRDFWLTPGAAVSLDRRHERALAAFRASSVHAVAGIGDPARFFDMLRAFGLEVIEHAMLDHQTYTSADVTFNDDLPVLMTEKDAVKCRGFAGHRIWSVPVDVQLSVDCEQRFEALLDRFCRLSTQKDGVSAP